MQLNNFLVDAPIVIQQTAGFSLENTVVKLLSSVGCTAMKLSLFFSVGREEPPLTSPAVQHLVPPELKAEWLSNWRQSARPSFNYETVHLKRRTFVYTRVNTMAL